jgi:hypothetical protein
MLPESPMYTRPRAAGGRLNGRKPAQPRPERDRERQHRLVLVLRERVDREVAARDDRERRRETVHVVEQVEGVRDAHEPQEPESPGEDVVADDFDVEAAREDDDGGGDLRGELRDRAQVPEVVDETRDEDDRDAARMPPSSPFQEMIPAASATATPATNPA